MEIKNIIKPILLGIQFDEITENIEELFVEKIRDLYIHKTFPEGYILEMNSINEYDSGSVQQNGSLYKFVYKLNVSFKIMSLQPNAIIEDCTIKSVTSTLICLEKFENIKIIIKNNKHSNFTKGQSIDIRIISSDIQYFGTSTKLFGKPVERFDFVTSLPTALYTLFIHDTNCLELPTFTKELQLPAIIDDEKQDLEEIKERLETQDLIKPIYERQNIFTVTGSGETNLITNYIISSKSFMNGIYYSVMSVSPFNETITKEHNRQIRLIFLNKFYTLLFKHKLEEDYFNK